MSQTIIVAPAGMRYDLARQLVNDHSFAHMWMCHGLDGTCPDGCDGSITSAECIGRTETYKRIRVYHSEHEVASFRKGVEDRIACRPAAQMSEDVDQGAYMDGYNSR